MTFSIVGRCGTTGDLGVAVSTARIAVGNRVPFVQSGVGAIATQANTNVALGHEGLRLLAAGYNAEIVLEKVLATDAQRASRQLSIIDQHGCQAVYTGKKTIGYQGHLKGLDCLVAGNMLTGPETLTAMQDVFENIEGPLEIRLLKALVAGQQAGGDKRGRVSAALIVVKMDNPHPDLDLRVDLHENPVGELAKIYGEYRAKF